MSTLPEIPSDPWERRDELLPALSDVQTSRIRSYGSVRRTRQSEILLEYGHVATTMFVVISGDLESDRTTRPERFASGSS